MNCSSSIQVPPIVHIVLSQIARLSSLGELSEAEVISKTARLVREELKPRGLKLHRSELPGGRLRFVIEAAKGGDVCDTVEYTADSEREFAASSN